MNYFDKKLFVTVGDRVYYEVAGDLRFIARFKHRGPFTKAKFLKQLASNHTIGSYLSELASGKAPLAVLRDSDESWYYGILEAFAGHPVGREAA